MNKQSKAAFFLLGTNVISSEEVIQIAPSLDYLTGSGKWNFDLEDRDRVLRLICSREEKESIVDYLKLNGLFKFEFQYLDTEIAYSEECEEVLYSSVSAFDLIT